MKKKLLAVLVCVLALSVVISGCGPKATPAPEVVEEPETGEEVGDKVDIGRPLGTGPVVLGDGLLVAGSDGTLYRIEKW